MAPLGVLRDDLTERLLAAKGPLTVVAPDRRQPQAGLLPVHDRQHRREFPWGFANTPMSSPDSRLSTTSSGSRRFVVRA